MTTRSVRPAMQMAMFQTEDLPLFSGVPVRAQAQVFDPQPVEPAPALAACRFCLDSGVVAGHYCFCAAGVQALHHKRNAQE